MSDREALKQTIFTFNIEKMAIEKRWKSVGKEIPDIDAGRLKVLNGVITWAQRKMVELNKQEYGDE